MKRRILFVDDEPRILQGLRRMLFGMRREWDMDFVEGGQEALNMLSMATCDVIISDMRMPGMDGGQLLDEVRLLYPRTIRIILSGQFDDESLSRAMEKSHLFLAKPCDAQLLMEVIDRACAIRDVLSKPEAKSIRSKLESLTGLSAMSSQLMAELQSEELSIPRLTEIISSDEAMMDAVIHLADTGYLDSLQIS